MTEARKPGHNLMWLAREFSRVSWFDVQDRFEELYMSLRAPAGMMLVCEDNNATERTTLFMAIPDKSLASLFPGFSEPSQLPAKPSFLVGNQTEMESQFGCPGDP